MPRLIPTVLLAVALVTPLLVPADAQQARYAKQKVVYHLNGSGGEGDKAYLQALRNIKNHIEAVGAGNIELKVIMHGDGVGILRSAVKNMTLQGEIANLKSTHKVAFVVCKNTLDQRKIAVQELFEVFEEDIVPSGVAELGHLQQQGYVYIKP